MHESIESFFLASVCLQLCRQFRGELPQYFLLLRRLALHVFKRLHKRRINAVFALMTRPLVLALSVLSVVRILPRPAFLFGLLLCLLKLMGCLQQRFFAQGTILRIDERLVELRLRPALLLANLFLQAFLVGL